MNPSTALATVLVDELVRCGVREAVLCPGSRSAPLAYALQEAERAGRLRLHVRVDERSAGYLALGLARGGGVVPVVTTSGTAVANLHPAVLEARHGRVPLLVISADRPPELRGTGANQTTDQVGIFGSAVRWSHDLGTPECRAGQNAVWRSVACRAWSAAVAVRGRELDAGPVQLNVPLRDPLVPGPSAGDGTGEVAWPEPLEGRPDGLPWVLPRAGYLPGPARAGRSLETHARTVMVLGDLPQGSWTADEAAARAQDAGWPVVAEPFGSVDRRRVLPHGPLLLSATDWVDAHAPDRVLVVGRPTLSRDVAALLRRPGVVVDLVAPHEDWADPSHLAQHVYDVETLMATLPEGPLADPEWTERWRRAGAAVATAAAEVVADSWPSGLAVAAAVATAVPAHSTLFVGSSNPVRDLALSLSGDASEDLYVVANRGLAGIDGCVSTAVGIALGQQATPRRQDPEQHGGHRFPERPAYALMGDLTFLHDTNGLLIGPDEPRPDLTIVVTNDDGGGIFTTLEPGEPSRATDFERVFGTPTGASISDLCRAHGVEHQRVTSRVQFAAAVARRPDGLRVVEVPVPRGGHRDLHAQLRAAAAGAVGDR